MIADMHRARHLAWELPEHGWEVEILSPDVSYQHESCVDLDSECFFNPSTKINWVPPFWPKLFHALGIGTIGWRAIVSMLFTGTRVLKRGHFDIIYFSTTQFSLFILGPIWRLCYGTPYALDFHDPLFSIDRVAPRWMKSGIKYTVSRWIFNQIEKITMTWSSAIVSVSPIYLEDLKRRYRANRPSWLERRCAAVIPFSVLPRDLEAVSPASVKAAGRPAKARIVYVGAGGPIMRRSFTLFCEALSALQSQQPALVAALQVEFYGTHFGWREGDARYFADIAKDYPAGTLVREWPGRVSYHRSLQLLLESHGAIILGVDDAGYMPSKLYLYAYSGKPLLGVVRSDGAAFAALQTAPKLGRALWFNDNGPMPLTKAVAVLRIFLEEVISGRSSNRHSVLQPFIASSMASHHAQLFERVLALEGRRLDRTVADPTPLGK